MKYMKPTSYVSGLFDGGGNIYFRISKSNRQLGYRINPSITIRIDEKDEIYGFIDEYLVENQIQFKISKTSTGSRRIEIDTRNNVERFLNEVESKTVQHSTPATFILDHFYPTRDNGDILQKKNFVKMLETIELLQPRRVANDSVKYDSSHFYDKWDIDENISPIMMKSDDEENDPSRSYMAGFFDGAGKIRPVIHESETSPTGYNLSLRVGMTRSWLRDSTMNKVEHIIEENDINYNINEQGRRTSIHITELDSVQKFLEYIQPNLIAKFEITQMTLEKILPAMRDNYHKTKQGVYDIVTLYEMVMSDSEDRKYTSEYFEKQWSDIESPVPDQ